MSVGQCTYLLPVWRLGCIARGGLSFGPRTLFDVPSRPFPWRPIRRIWAVRGLEESSAPRQLAMRECGELAERFTWSPTSLELWHASRHLEGGASLGHFGLLELLDCVSEREG